MSGLQVLEAERHADMDDISEGSRKWLQMAIREALSHGPLDGEALYRVLVSMTRPGDLRTNGARLARWMEWALVEIGARERWSL